MWTFNRIASLIKDHCMIWVFIILWCTYICRRENRVWDNGNEISEFQLLPQLYMIWTFLSLEYFILKTSFWMHNYFHFFMVMEEVKNMHLFIGLYYTEFLDIVKNLILPSNNCIFLFAYNLIKCGRKLSWKFNFCWKCTLLLIMCRKNDKRFGITLELWL